MQQGCQNNAMKRAVVLCSLPLAILLLVGCTQFPELDHTVTKETNDARYPALVPIEPLIAQSRSTDVDPVETEASLQARLASLRARANRLRGSVLSGREKQRLEAGLQ